MTSMFNTTEATMQPDLEDQTDLVKLIAYGYFSPVIIAVGLFGDVMTLVVLSHSSLRKASVVYAYLFYLALTDLLTLISVIPMILWLVGIKNVSWPATVYYAHIGFPLVNALMGASVFIVVSLTLSQYVAVCYPLSTTTRFRSRRVCTYLVIAAYVISFIANAPWCAKSHAVSTCFVESSPQQPLPIRSSVGGTEVSENSHYRNDLESDCHYEAATNEKIAGTTWFIAYDWIREIIVRVVPFIVVAYFNIRIMTTYRTMRKHRFTVISSQQRMTIRRKANLEERRLMSMLVVIIIIFFICTIPAAFTSILISKHWEHSLRLQIFRAIANTLEFTKFALNFYFYCMVNPDIRQLCKTQLLCQSYEGLQTKFRSSSFVGASLRINSPSMVVNRERSCYRSTPSGDRRRSPKYLAPIDSCKECSLELTRNCIEKADTDSATDEQKQNSQLLC